MTTINKIKIQRIGIITAIGLMLAATLVAQNSDPAASVQAFYAYEQKASQVFSRRNLDPRRDRMTARLYNLFRDELRKQNAHLKSNADDKPFFGDGFPFRPIDEPCDVNGRSYKRRYQVQADGRIREDRVDIPVRFAYPRPCTIESITYKVRMVRSPSKWLVDDVIFEDGSTLSQAMKNHRY